MSETLQTFNSSILRPGLHKNKVLSIAKPGTVVAFYDTETTGLHPERDDHIIEFAGILCRVEPDYTLTRLSETQIYIKNRKPLSEDVVNLTKITEDFLADKPDEEDVVDDIYDFLQQADWVCGHNVPFDNQMVETTMSRHNIPSPISEFLDTLELARDIIVPGATANYKLSTIAEAFKIDDGVQFHSAIADIGVTVSVFENFLKHYQHQHDEDTPDYLTPVITRVSYWEKQLPDKTLKRIYVTTNLGTLYYDADSGWLWGKDCDYTRINRETFDTDVMNFVGVNTMKDLLAFRGKK